MKKQILNLLILFYLIFFSVACNDNNDTKQQLNNNFFDCNWEIDYDCDININKKYDNFLACEYKGFMDNFVDNFYCNEFYFIKGLAQNIEHEYGRNIKFIEDLKGNFPKDITSFIAWGDGYTFVCLNRVDHLNMYENQDTLLMLLCPAIYLPKYLSDSVPPLIPFYEKECDYTTMSCAHSTLKLENGNVSGYILPKTSDSLRIFTTMPYSELIKLLKLKLKEGE